MAGSSFLLQGRTGINVGDEGFLWYGAQQTARGAVPVRDFQSYDPGRYYWSALGTFLFGDGLVALRFSETLFQIIGLWAGLLAANRIAGNWAQLAAIGVVVVLWMAPSHKLFDHTILLCGIWIALRLVEEPIPTRIFAAGVFVGLCFFFGRNHALYNFLAQASVLLLLHFKVRPLLSTSHFGMWMAGIIVGLAPMIIMVVCVPGFGPSYVESIRSIFRQGANLSLPVPWPGRIALSSISGVSQFILGIFLVILPLAYIAAIVSSVPMRPEAIKDHALLIACAFTGLFYLHHAFARADFSHLAQAIHPFILLILVLPSSLATNKSYRWTAIVTLIATALFCLGRQTPLYQRLTSHKSWIAFDAPGKIFVPPSVNQLFACLREFASKNIQPGEGVLVAPFTPAFYPMLEQKSPLWELAFFFPAAAQRQEEMIRELTAKNVNWAIISDTPPDQREDLRFSETHKLVWRYLQEDFDLVENSCVPKPTQIFHRKSARLLPD